MAELPMADERAEVCETCRFWEQTDIHREAGGMDGACKRYPPVLPHTESQIREAHSITGQDGKRYGFWPETASFEWCGEWQARKDTTPTV